MQFFLYTFWHQTMNIFSGQGQEKNYFHFWETNTYKLLLLQKLKFPLGKENIPQN